MGSTIWTPSARGSSRSPIASLLSSHKASTSMWTFLCRNASLCPSPWAQSVIPESKFTTFGSFGCWKFSCTTAVLSAVGRPNRFIRPSSQRSSFPQAIQSEPTAPRPPQAQRARTAGARRPPLCLPPIEQRRRCRAPLSVEGEEPSGRGVSISLVKVSVCFGRWVPGEFRSDHLCGVRTQAL